MTKTRILIGRCAAMLLFSLAIAPAGLAATRTACQARSFNSGQDQLAYQDCGSGAPVVIMPGGPGLDAAYMKALVEDVVRTGRRAILLEPRGTGASRAAIGDGSKLTVVGSIADVEALRQAVGAQRVTLIGHSFGGAVIQAYAAAHPDHVAKLILLDSTGPTLRAPPGSLDSWRTRVDAAALSKYDAMRAAGDRLGAMKLKFAASFYHRDRGDAFLAALPDQEIHLDVGRLADDYAKNYDVTTAPRRTFPVVIIAGDIDWIRGHEPALERAYPGARKIIVPHAGHFSWIDAPVAARDAVRAALRWTQKGVDL